MLVISLSLLFNFLSICDGYLDYCYDLSVISWSCLFYGVIVGYDIALIEDYIRGLLVLLYFVYFV